MDMQDGVCICWAHWVRTAGAGEQCWASPLLFWFVLWFFLWPHLTPSCIKPRLVTNSFFHCHSLEAIGKSSEAWDEVYHGWESSAEVSSWKEMKTSIIEHGGICINLMMFNQCRLRATAAQVGLGTLMQPCSGFTGTIPCWLLRVHGQSSKQHRSRAQTMETMDQWYHWYPYEGQKESLGPCIPRLGRVEWCGGGHIGWSEVGKAAAEGGRDPGTHGTLGKRPSKISKILLGRCCESKQRQYPMSCKQFLMSSRTWLLKLLNILAASCCQLRALQCLRHVSGRLHE